ncbi:putative immunity protein [Mycolicibacterium sediminis]|uniref:putative immunity protein n=1 Tax=Mycolicibacterium sediminis TaxID=1286180 RepID=UPI0013CF5EE2|nr:hypothetical protein [Mycolicibacterium sediminis]
MARSPKNGANPDPETHQALARWAAECAERALPIFENARPGDLRPRSAIDTLRAWIRGEVPMTSCRTAAFAAHAAAREAERAGAPAAVAAARAAGQAAAVAHMAGHARHAADYATKAGAPVATESPGRPTFCDRVAERDVACENRAMRQERDSR